MVRKHKPDVNKLNLKKREANPLHSGPGQFWHRRGTPESKRRPELDWAELGADPTPHIPRTRWSHEAPALAVFSFFSLFSSCSNKYLSNDWVHFVLISDLCFSHTDRSQGALLFSRGTCGNIKWSLMGSEARSQCSCLSVWDETWQSVGGSHVSLYSHWRGKQHNMKTCFWLFFLSLSRSSFQRCLIGTKYTRCYCLSKTGLSSQW